MAVNRKTTYTNFYFDIEDCEDYNGQIITEELLKEYIHKVFDDTKINLIRSIDFSFIDSLENKKINSFFISYDPYEGLELECYTEEDDEMFEARLKLLEERRKNKPTKEERARLKKEKELKAKRDLFLKLKEELGEWDDYSKRSKSNIFKK